MFECNTKSFEIGNMPQKSSELRQASYNSKFTLGRIPYLFYKSGVLLSGSHSFDVRNNFIFLAISVIIPRFEKLSISAARYF